MGYNLFLNYNILFSLHLRFLINVDDSIFYNYDKDLDKSHRFKGTELFVVGVVDSSTRESNMRKIFVFLDA